MTKSTRETKVSKSFLETFGAPQVKYCGTEKYCAACKEQSQRKMPSSTVPNTPSIAIVTSLKEIVEEE